VCVCGGGGDHFPALVLFGSDSSSSTECFCMLICVYTALGSCCQLCEYVHIPLHVCNPLAYQQRWSLGVMRGWGEDTFKTGAICIYIYTAPATVGSLVCE